MGTRGHFYTFDSGEEEGRIDDDDVGMMGKHFPVTEDTVRVAIFMRNLKCPTPRLVF